MRVIQIVQGVAFITNVQYTLEELMLNNLSSYFHIIIFYHIVTIYWCGRNFTPSISSTLDIFTVFH